METVDPEASTEAGACLWQIDVQHAGGWYYAATLRAGTAGFLGLEASWSFELERVQSEGIAGLALGLIPSAVLELGVRTQLSRARRNPHPD